MSVPQKTAVAIFRIGDVCLKILAYGEKPPYRYMAQLEKLIDPAILKEAPHLAYTFTPQDVSAIRKLSKEAEDAFFNYQSAVLQPINLPTNPPADEPTNDKDKD